MERSQKSQWGFRASENVFGEEEEETISHETGMGDEDGSRYR